jgi:hypothetical protein
MRTLPPARLIGLGRSDRVTGGFGIVFTCLADAGGGLAANGAFRWSAAHAKPEAVSRSRQPGFLVESAGRVPANNSRNPVTNIAPAKVSEQIKVNTDFLV